MNGIKFVEEFGKATGGEFPMLKFNSATYIKDKRKLQVRFIISAFDVRSFTQAQQDKVAAVVEEMFNGIETEIIYIRTYADENTVKNKVLEFFNLRNQMIFRRLKEENIAISVSGEYIDVELRFDPPTYKMLAAADTAEALSDWLDVNFNHKINVTVKETDCSDVGGDGDYIDTVVYRDSAVRLIQAEQGEKIYAGSRTAGISQLPNYICDVKSSAENIVLCGRISGLTKSSYNNKKYNPDDPKSGPTKKPIVKFFIDDTTGRMECVCFPRSDEEAACFDALADRDEVMCAGRVSLSSYNNALGLTANAVFRCSIDFSSVVTRSSKPEPAKYTVIKPEPYEENVVKTLFDEPEKREISPYFKGKTFVVFDFEATGLQIASIEPIEIGAAKIVDGKVTETFSTLLNPHSPIPQEVAEKTRITDDMVADKPSFTEVLPDFFKFTRGAVLVGHNLSGYDFPLLAKYADREGYVFDNEMEDTLLLARRYIPEVRHWGLEALSRAFNITHENAHRAMADVLATVEVLRIIAQRM